MSVGKGKKPNTGLLYWEIFRETSFSEKRGSFQKKKSCSHGEGEGPQPQKNKCSEEIWGDLRGVETCAFKTREKEEKKIKNKKTIGHRQTRRQSVRRRLLLLVLAGRWCLGELKHVIPLCLSLSLSVSQACHTTLSLSFSICLSTCRARACHTTH